MTAIERFVSTPEGKALLAEAEDRLAEELAAVSELRAAAVEWYRRLHDRNGFDEFWDAEDRLEEAAGRLAELEEQCNSET